MTIKRKLSESAIDQAGGSERRLRSGRTTFVTTSSVTNTKSTGSPSRVSHSPRKRIQPLKPDVAQKDQMDDAAEGNSERSLKSPKTLKRREIKTQKVSKNRSDAVKDQLIPVEEASQLYGDYGAGKESSSTSSFGFNLLKTRS
jgi:hypothetical protein